MHKTVYCFALITTSRHLICI